MERLSAQQQFVLVRRCLRRRPRQTAPLAGSMVVNLCNTSSSSIAEARATGVAMQWVNTAAWKLGMLVSNEAYQAI